MMKVAIPVWGDRISPVFDVAELIVIVTQEGGQEIDRTELKVVESDNCSRIKTLLYWNVDVLICGAISSGILEGLHSEGIHVIAHISGLFDEVLCDFFQGVRIEQKYALPGCCASSHKRSHRRMNRCRNHARKRLTT